MLHSGWIACNRRCQTRLNAADAIELFAACWLDTPAGEGSRRGSVGVVSSFGLELGQAWEDLQRVAVEDVDAVLLGEKGEFLDLLDQVVT